MGHLIDIAGPYALRASAILTGSYVGALISSVIGSGARVNDFNQLIVYVDFTKGSLTTAELKIEFNPIGSADLYSETSETSSVASNVDTRAVNEVIHQLSATGKHRFAIPLCDGDVKISIKGTGTATSSLAAIKVALGKTYA